MLVVHTYRRFRPTVLAAFALGIALTLAPASMAADLYMVSVGITNAKGLSKLTATAKDARDMARWAHTQEKKMFNRVFVNTITDTQATKRNILGALSGLRSRVKPGDYVIFYESSHGGLNKSGEFTMNAYDGTVSFREMATALKGVAGTKIVIIDACHSGEAATSGAGADLVVFSSSKANQLSFDGPAGGNSLFTQHFLAGLYGKADYNKDRAVTLQEAATYAANRLKDANKGKTAKNHQDMMWSVPTGTPVSLRLTSVK
jgi:hypothetical protein